MAVYGQRPNNGAIVHFHSTRSVAVSVLANLDGADLPPPITTYYVMRVRKLPLAPFHAQGDARLARAVGETAQNLLVNHGPVVAGASLSTALDTAKGLEETARLFLLLQGRRTRYLTEERVDALRTAFPIKAQGLR